jgi:hypothetical protein
MDAERTDLEPGAIIVIKQAKIGEYQEQRNVSLNFTSTFYVHTPADPINIPEVQAL